MKKIIAMILMLGLMATSAMAAAKIAFVDTQTVFDKTKLGKKYQGISRNTTKAARRSLIWIRMRCRSCRKTSSNRSRGRP